VPYEDARRAFREHLANLAAPNQDRKRAALMAGELMELFLGWLKDNRSRPTYTNRRTHCSGFAAFRPAGRQTPIADLPALKM
jgi:hypothetical protein